MLKGKHACIKYIVLAKNRAVPAHEVMLYSASYSETIVLSSANDLKDKI